MIFFILIVTIVIDIFFIYQSYYDFNKKQILFSIIELYISFLCLIPVICYIWYLTKDILGF